MIEVQGLVKCYGSHMAVDHLTFTASSHKVYGFLGPNGAGKSTTMNMMTGCLGATEGSIRIDGIDMVQEPEKAKAHIGYLPETPPLYPDMTVTEYLTFAAELKKIPKEKRPAEVERVCADCNLTSVSGRLIRNLSKGYKQRVGLANALLGSPEVLILDEPTVGLDPKQILEIRQLIRSLGESHTVFFSSHILSEVNAVCDHIFILSHGKLVASDTPEGLEEQFQSGGTVEIIVKAPAPQVSAVLTAISILSAFQLKELSEDRTQVTFTTSQEDALCETLFFAFAEAGLPILRMTASRASLEDIFLELTQDGEESAAAETVEETAALPPENPEEKEEDKAC